MQKKEKKKKVIVIVILGSTATGKSDLAIRIAKKFDGEVISADSRQVYKYLNIGTGKITKKEMKNIPHHLLDVTNPKRIFTVTKYKKMAEKAIENILKRNKIPIICGGTGFYIDAITKNLILPEVPPKMKLRKRLSHLSAMQLFYKLKKLDKIRAKNIDPNNKVRLIRAIEIAKTLGKVPNLKTKPSKYEFVKIGLYVKPEILQKKIQKRVQKMFQDGLLREIKKLKKMGVSKKRLQEFGFEYFEPTEKKVITETIKYAKRQKTWFKRDKKIKWFNPKKYKEIERYIKTKVV